MRDEDTYSRSVAVTGSVVTDGRLRFTSPLDLEAWGYDHLMGRLSWEYLVDGEENDVPRHDDSALERVMELAGEAIRTTMRVRVADGLYATWAVYGLDVGRQDEFLERAWGEFLTAIANERFHQRAQHRKGTQPE